MKWSPPVDSHTHTLYNRKICVSVGGCITLETSRFLKLRTWKLYIPGTSWQNRVVERDIIKKDQKEDRRGVIKSSERQFFALFYHKVSFYKTYFINLDQFWWSFYLNLQNTLLTTSLEPREVPPSLLVPTVWVRTTNAKSTGLLKRWVSVCGYDSTTQENQISCSPYLQSKIMGSETFFLVLFSPRLSLHNDKKNPRRDMISDTDDKIYTPIDTETPQFIE